MYHLKFLRNKYGKELLIDCLKVSDLEDFAGQRTPFTANFYEIFIITQGTGVFHFDYERIPYKKGTIMFLKPNGRRMWEMENELDGYFLIFEAEFIERFFTDTLFIYRFHFFHNVEAPSFLNLTSEEYNVTLPTVVELQNEINNLREDSSHMLRSLLYYFLIKLNRIYTNQYKLPETLLENQEILNFRKLLESFIREKHQVQDYADLLQISRIYLNKLVKKNFGVSANDIIRNRLLLEAKKEILYSQKSINEIAFDLNFSEPANFNRFFKQHTNKTPNQYRKELSN